MTPYIVAAGFYLIVTIPMTKLINSMEQRMAGGRKKRKKGVTITSEEAVLPDSDAAVSKSLRMSETLGRLQPYQPLRRCGYERRKHKCS